MYTIEKYCTLHYFVRTGIGPLYLKPIANEFCVGFMEHCGRHTIIHQFVKKELVNPELSPDKTERREIRVEGVKVSINSTCFVTGVEWREEITRPFRHELEKNDFWMSSMGLTYHPL